MNKNTKEITLDKLVENLAEVGMFESDDNEAVAVLFEAMEKMAREHGYCHLLQVKMKIILTLISSK